MKAFQQFFEDLAESWDEQQPEDREEKLVHLLQPHQEMITSANTILELGCGTGDLNRILKSFSGNSSLFSIDLAFKMLRKAKQKSVTIRLAEADVHTLPFPNHCCDLIVCHNCFAHFSNKHQSLKEIYRLLKPNGHLLVLHDGNRETINDLHQSARNPVIHNDLIPSRQEMFCLLQNCGYKNIQVEDTANYFLAIGKTR